MKHSVSITITAESEDDRTCIVLWEVNPPCPHMTPDTQKLFTSMLDTAAGLALREIVRHAKPEEQPA